MKIMTSIAAALAAIAVAAGSAAANEGPTRWTKTAELSSYPQVSRLAQGQCTLIVSNCEICRLLDAMELHALREGARTACSG